ncbi:MAG TPA: rhodanese-like domain-containing protein [Terriglobia bacterium]|nr:rhodanese-like domain-containing protein [Terriglobia bacterium]
MRKSCLLVVICGAALLALVCAGFYASIYLRAASPAEQDPWPQSQLIAPQTLAREIEAKGKMPRVICVGFPVLYQSAHIPGALLEGPANEAAGLAKLKQWARRAPKNSRVVIYCGCCPFNVCPNIRPAYEALRKAGLTNVQVLALRSNFLTDWMDKGYPFEAEK